MRAHHATPAPPGLPRALLAPLVSLAAAVSLALPVAVLTPAAPVAAASTAPLSGTIVDGAGQPVTGAEVLLFQDDVAASDASDTPDATASTDAAGGYAFGTVAPATYTVIVRPAEGQSTLASTSDHVRVSTTPKVRSFTVPAATVVGAVTGSDGMAVGGAVVQADSNGNQPSTRTYPDGRYRLSVAPGAAQVTAQPTVANPLLDVPTTADVTVPASGVLTRDLTLRAPNLRGRALAPDGSTAVGGALVTLTTGNGSVVGSVASRSDGTFGFSAVPGSYRLQVEPPDPNPASWAHHTGDVFDLTDADTVGAPAVHDVTLQGANVTGVVRTPDGDPAPRAFVFFIGTGTDNTWEQTRADREGRYGISLPHAGSFWVFIYGTSGSSSVYLDRNYTVDVPSLPATQDLVFLRPNVIGHVVTADGVPVAGASVSVSDNGSGPDLVGYASTDDDGSFGMRVSPGQHRLVADPPQTLLDGVRTVQQITVPDTGALSGLTVTLRKPDPAEYSLDPVPFTIAGQPADTVGTAPVISGDGNVVASLVSRGSACGESGCTFTGAPRTSAPTATAGYARGVVLHDVVAGSDQLLAAPDGTSVNPDGHVALSHDGSTVAFTTVQNGLVAGDDDWSEDLFVLERGTGQLTRIAADPADPSGTYMAPWFGQSPVLSGDARRVVVAQQREDAGYNYLWDLVVLSLDASGAEVDRTRVDVASPDELYYTLSRDGSTLAWTQFENGSWGLHVLDLASGTEDPVRPFNPGAAQWDPEYVAPSLSDDGSVVAYAVRVLRAGDRALEAVRVVDRSTDTGSVPAFFDQTRSGRGEQSFVLSGDGSRLAVVADGPEPEDSNNHAWMVDLGTGAATLVSTDSYGRPLPTGVRDLALAQDPGTLALGLSSYPGQETNGVVVLATEDSEAPTWPSDAAITTAPTDLGVTSIRLHWTEAQDNGRIAGYRIYQGGTQIGSTTAGTRQFRATGLTPDTSYEFSVQAVDGAHNESTDGPHATARTLPEDTTQLLPLDLAAAPGGVLHASWEAPTGADAVIVRLFQGDTQVDERTVAANATSLDLTGLAADTAYSVQVFVSSGGDVRAFTERGTATTLPLTLESVTWNASTAGGGRAVLGSTAAITATAETGRAVTARVDFTSWFDDQQQLLDHPAPRSALVTLTEDPASPGRYRGSFTLAEGIARLTGMTATVSDGHGGARSLASSHAPTDVGNRLLVTVDAPAGSIPGGHIQVLDAQSGAGSSGGLDGATVFTASNLPDAGSYRAAVYDADGQLLGDRGGLALVGGLTTPATLTPHLPAQLTVIAHDPSGAVVDGGAFSVYDVDTGDLLQRLTLAGTGQTVRRLHEGQQVRVVPDYDPQLLLQDDDRTVVLSAGENTLELSPTAVPRATLSGTVTYDDGTPVSGAQVRLDQTRGGWTSSERATTDDGGHYSVNGLRVPGTVSVTKGALSRDLDVDLAGGPQQVDPVLHGPRQYTLRLRLFTRSPGSVSESGPVPLDWRTSVHYGMSLRVGGAPVWNSSTEVDDQGSTVLGISGIPGQTVEWCIQGSEAGVVPTCVTHVLDTGDNPVLEMHAGPATAVHLRLVDESGTPTGLSRVSLYRLEDGSRHQVRTIDAFGDVNTQVSGAGDYLAEATDPSRAGQVHFTVTPEDTTVDAGDLVLHPAAHFRGEDSHVVAARGDVPVGGDVSLRATWTNQGSALTDAVARISVPDGTTLVDGSILRGTSPVTGTPGAGYVDVPVGAIPAGGQGSLTYRLRAGASAGGTIVGGVSLRYGDAGNEPLTPATVRVAALTIAGPATSGSLRVPVSGRAPANQMVRVFDDGALVASALSGPGGFWSTSATLPRRAAARPVHTLVAQVGDTLSARLGVTVDDSYPVATRVSMYQLDSGFANGRTFTFDPRDGVARFPFVYVPGQPLVLEVHFDEPGLVSNAHVHIGSNVVSASPNSSGTFVARYTGYATGPVSLDFDAQAKPMDMSTPGDSEQTVRDDQPAPFAGFTTSDVSPPDPTGTGPRVGSWTTQLPNIGGSARSTLTVSREDYAPSSRDLLSRAATGSPAYGVSLPTISGSTISYSMVIPASQLPGLTAQLATSPDPQSSWLASALQSEAVRSGGLNSGGDAAVRVGFELAFNGTTTLDSALSAFGAGDKYQKLTDALGLLGGCSPAATQSFTDRAQRIAYASAASDIAGAAFNIGALVLGPETFGLGTVALGVLGWALDKATGYAIDAATDSLISDIKASPDCNDDDDSDDDDSDDDSDDIADPTWIYDPSGFTFEGSRSQRIGGVTATLLQGDTADGPWTAWNADWYGQTNPLQTDNDGRYGWDVPEGWWKVAFAKDGYEPAYSRVMRVLPPHLDVDVSLVKDGFPHVTSAAWGDGVVDVGFDRMVRSASVRQDGAVSVVDGSGAPVPGTWSAVAAGTDDNGVDLQRGARFTPTDPAAPGSHLVVTVDAIADYSGKLMTQPYTADLTVPTVADVPAAPGAVAAQAGERSATVSWTAPDDHGSPITGYLVTALPSGQQLTAGATADSLQVTGLTPGSPYTFTVTATNAVGTGPASDPSNQVVPTALAPDTTLTGGPADGSFTTTREARLQWTDSAGPGGGYECTVDGTERACASGTLRLTRLSSGTHTFTVAARDADGDVDPTPATVTWTVPRDDVVLKHDHGWKVHRKTWAYDGTYSEAVRRGATLSTRVDHVRGLALVVTRAPHAGSVKVLLGGHPVRTLDLSARRTAHRQVLQVARFNHARSGLLEIVVASGNKTVVVEGVGVATG